MIDAANSTLFGQLQGLGTCEVANAIERFEVRLRNEGFADSSIRLMTPPAVVVGHATTLRIRCSSPPTGGHDYIEKTEWWNYLLNIPEPRILVIEDIDRQPGLGALVGEVHAHILRTLGCVGVATNGAIRDLPALTKMGFLAYASNLAVSHAYSHIVEIGGTVVLGGLKISPGDILHGDQHGLLSIPKEIVAKIPDAVLELRQREIKLFEVCSGNDLKIDELRNVIRELRRDGNTSTFVAPSGGAR